MKRVYVDEDYCMGCGLCQVYCLTHHSESKNIIKAYKKEDPKPVSRIVKEEKEPNWLALQCRHCEEAPCLDACLTGAMYRDPETGAVQRDEDKCIGCWTCVMICPLGAIKRDIEGEEVASKCDLCPDEDIPICVQKCPNEALEYREVEE